MTTTHCRHNADLMNLFSNTIEQQCRLMLKLLATIVTSDYCVAILCAVIINFKVSSDMAAGPLARLKCHMAANYGKPTQSTRIATPRLMAIGQYGGVVAQWSLQVSVKF